MLCVDPDARVTDGLTGLLEREGFHVDTEHDGRRALKLALAGGYDAVVIETHLPGISGLEILKRLRREAATAQVVLLTGTPSVDAAIEATRLDAVYLTKTTATLSQIVGVLRRAAPRTQQTPELFAMREEMALDEDARQPGVLARMLLSPGITFPQFLRVADALRSALGDRTAAVPRSSPTWETVHPLVREALLRIEQAGTRWAALSEEVLATELSIRTGAVWRLFHQQFGLSFLECRRAVVMRRAVRALAAQREHVAQIAYGLGYEHPSSFNRDFRRFLHTAPTLFRRLVWSETVKE